MQEFITTFLISYIWHTLGISIGYHRLLAHRSFKCPKVVEHFWVLGGYLAFQTSPIWWGTMHRAHHKYSDTTRDPHFPKLGWRRSIYGWIFDDTYPEHIDPLKSKDLINDPVYRFLEQGGDIQRAHLLNGFLCFLFRIALFVIFGWQVALASLLAGLLLQQVALLFNPLSHMKTQGYQSFETDDESRNIPWLAILTLGEGWHNNHHAFPGSARSGLKPTEVDPSWLVIRFMKLFGLVGWIHEESMSSTHKPRKPVRALNEPVEASKAA